MRRALITTTINVPHNLRLWARQLSKDDIIVVAGDVKTPHDDVRELTNELHHNFCGAVYLHPEDPNVRDWRTNEVVGFNSIQRRNLALLEVLPHDVDYIITVDDDNAPVGDDWVAKVDAILNDELQSQAVVSSETGWFNVGNLLSPKVTHRGFPLSRRHEKGTVTYALRDARVGVFASLWLGDPDIDAVERIVSNPEVFDFTGYNATLATDTWCPFNSQATAYRAELAPLMAVWPGVGRFDDIWASYVARRVMDHLGWSVRYGAPLVRQERNPHNLVRDLEQELHGYRWTELLTETLRDVDLDGIIDVVECFKVCTLALLDIALTSVSPVFGCMIGDETVQFWTAWLQDLETIMKSRGKK